MKNLFSLILAITLSIHANTAFPQSNENLEKAVIAFEKAEAFYKVQEYEKALEQYKESYLLSLEPNLLFNIGQCQRQNKNYEEAIKTYKTYLREVPNTEYRNIVETYIKEMEELLKTVKPEISPTSKPETMPSSAISAPEVIPTPAQESSFNAKPLYVAAGVAGGLGAASGILALITGLKVQDLQANTNAPDANEIAKNFKQARLFGIGSDILIVGAIGVGGAGFLLKQTSKKHKETVIVSANSSKIAITFKF